MYKKYEELRKERHISDYEVAKQTGVSTSTLSNWKHGRYTPKVNKLKLIADYFGVPLESLLDAGEVKS